MNKTFGTFGVLLKFVAFKICGVALIWQCFQFCANNNCCNNYCDNICDILIFIAKFAEFLYLI